MRLEAVLDTAAGHSATLALDVEGAVWPWDGGGAPRRLQWQ
jgi:hypothetical protein